MDKLNLISIASIIYFNTFIVFLLFFGELFLLSKKGIYYNRSLRVHLTMGAIFIATIFIII